MSDDCAPRKYSPTQDDEKNNLMILIIQSGDIKANANSEYLLMPAETASSDTQCIVIKVTKQKKTGRHRNVPRAAIGTIAKARNLNSRND